MNILKYIDTRIIPIQLGYTKEEILDCFNQSTTDQLPVIENSLFIGIISKKSILNLKNNDVIDLNEINVSPISLTINSHVFDSFNKFQQLENELIALVTDTNEYKGCVSSQSILHNLSLANSFIGVGGILVIKCKSMHFSLSELARIIENNSAKILTFIINDLPLTNEIEVHIKVNTLNLRSIISNIERYNYEVVEHRNSIDIDEDLNTKYSLLLKYLDI